MLEELNAFGRGRSSSTSSVKVRFCQSKYINFPGKEFHSEGPKYTDVPFHQRFNMGECSEFPTMGARGFQCQQTAKKAPGRRSKAALASCRS